MLPIFNTDSPTMQYIENRLSDTIADTDPIYWDDDEHLNTWQFSAEKKSLCDDIDNNADCHYMEHQPDEHDSMVASFSDHVDHTSSHILEQVCSPIRSPLNEESEGEDSKSEISNGSSSDNTQDYLTGSSGDYDLASPSTYPAPLHLVECEQGKTTTVSSTTTTASPKLEMGGANSSSVEVLSSGNINYSSYPIHYPIIKGTHYDADENVISRPAETGVFRMNQNQCSTLPSSNFLEQTIPLHMEKINNNDRRIQNQSTSPSSELVRWKMGNDHHKRQRVTEENIYVGEEEAGCRCTKTKCLKLYCDCFRRGRICRSVCECIDCKNTEEESGPFGARTQMIQEILKRRPDAFHKRIKRPDATCACKNSK